MKYVFKGKRYSPEEWEELHKEISKVIIPPENKSESEVFIFSPRKKLSLRERRERNRISARRHYYENKENEIKRIREYELKNPDKVKTYRKKSFAKWYAKKHGKLFMRKYMK
jgi:hypothetical protein